MLTLYWYEPVGADITDVETVVTRPRYDGYGLYIEVPHSMKSGRKMLLGRVEGDDKASMMRVNLLTEYGGGET
jgi:hypothetical protein